MKVSRPLPCVLLALAGLVLLRAAPAPHPDRPDRLVETRDGFSVEYSPGQEAWMERAFAEMKKDAAKPAAPDTTPTTPEPGPAAPGSARSLQENRAQLLAAVAKQVGLAKPTALQGRVFDTFLGYYKLSSELIQSASREIPAALAVRRVAIWQRDDLVARLRNGAKIEGMMYDPATDGGMFSFKFNLEAGSLGERFKEINDEIEAQKLKHSFDYGEGTYSASVTLGKTPDARKKTRKAAAPAAQDFAAIVSEIVFPVIYPGDATSAPTDKDFDYLPGALAFARTTLRQQATSYRDPNMVTVILHETAETGLVETVIGSRDRRWLCDGTANYAAWRVARDLAGPEFAQQVYDLDDQLRRHAAHQPKIDLAAWSAVERQRKTEAKTELNRARYAFATRALFLLAERHGDDAVAQLWAEVAKTPRKKASAKTFADAYRKRFNGDLDTLVKEAENKPIPPAPAPASPQA